MPDKPKIESSKEKKRRLKLFLYGGYGVGKTVFSLQFPKPYVIDMEKGTNPYIDDFEFDYTCTNDPDEIFELVKWLSKNKHKYQTLIFDSITPYWEALQDKWQKIFLKRKVGTPGYKVEYYDMQPKDWMPVKNEFRRLTRMLTDIDMNVVITAHEKDKYEGFMTKEQKVIGKTFDGEKSLPYLFDIVLRLENRPDGKRVAYSTPEEGGKQRGLRKRIPDKFLFNLDQKSFDFFEHFDMNREAVPNAEDTKEAQEPQAEQGKPSETPAKAQEVKQEPEKEKEKKPEKPESKQEEPVKAEFPQRAPKKATKTQVKKLEAETKEIPKEKVVQALNGYGASEFQELSSEDAASILGKLEKRK